MNLNTEASPVRNLTLAWALVGTLSIGAIITTWWQTMGKPSLQSYDELSRQLLTMSDVKQSESDISQRFQRTQLELESWNTRLTKLKERTQAHENEGQFLKWLTEQANVHEITIRDYRPGQYSVENGYQSRNVQLTTFGKYASICKFINELRDGPRMLRITSLEITPRDRLEESYSTTLHLKLFCVTNELASSSVGANHGS